MNDVLFDFLDSFMVVYLDDIIIYNQNVQDHLVYLGKVFHRLRENLLYVKKEKCEFAQTEIKFLGHLVSKKQIQMDRSKGYSKIAILLTNLLKKKREWKWELEYAVEQRYSTHEKEMTAVIHCLETWKHYLMGTKFIV
ncbi:hypothetical protein AAG906_036891 [Vitis piasezkii]